jgi:histidine triad (HIT) family protein
MEYCKCCDEKLIEEYYMNENDTCIMLTLEWYSPPWILEGSVFIFPKAHKKTPFELSDQELADTFDLLRKAKTIIDERYNPDGYNMGWNVWEIGWQEIPHAHFNVMPRYKDEPHAGKWIRYFFKQENNRRVSKW